MRLLSVLFLCMCFTVLACNDTEEITIGSPSSEAPVALLSASERMNEIKVILQTGDSAGVMTSEKEVGLELYKGGIMDAGKAYYIPGEKYEEAMRNNSQFAVLQQAAAEKKEQLFGESKKKVATRLN